MSGTRVSIYLSVVLLSGCATEVRISPFVNSVNVNSGIVEFINKSPDKGMNLIIYNNSIDCTYPKAVAMFEPGVRHVAKVDYQKSLTMAIYYHNIGTSRIVTCGAIFTVPFEKGELRAMSYFDPERNQCLTTFATKTDNNTWAPLENVKKRQPPASTPTVFGGGSFCQKEEG